MDNSTKVENTGNAFFNHMFGDKDTKSNVINIIQYTLVGIIPLIILSKSMQHIFPDADDRKNNFELSIEIIGQLTMLFIGIFFIDRLIRYFKSYSGEKYDDISPLSLILPLTIVLFSIPSKIGQKTKIITDRVLRALNIEKQPEIEEEKIEIKPTIPIMNDMRDMMGQQGVVDVPPALQSVATNPTKAPESVGRVSTSNSNNSNTNTNTKTDNNTNNENFNNMFEPFASGSGSGSGGLGYTPF